MEARARPEDALDFEWRLTGLACDVRVLQQLQPALRKGGWKVTVAVHGGSQIIAVWPGFRERVYGIAIDVGSSPGPIATPGMRAAMASTSGSATEPTATTTEIAMHRSPADP